MRYIMLTVLIFLFFAGITEARTFRIKAPDGAVSISVDEDTITVQTVAKNIKQRIAKLNEMARNNPDCYQLIYPITVQIMTLISLIPGSALSQPVLVQRIEAMSDEAFANFLLIMEGESFSDDKLLLLRQIAAKNYFTAEQLGAILNQFTYTDDKMSAVLVVLHRIIDPENLFSLQEKFELDADKKRFMDIISE